MEVFLWENYLKEEEKEEKSEKKEKCLKIEDIYKVIKKLDGIKNINIDNYGMPVFGDDGRKKIKVNINFEKDVDISEQLAKIIEEFPSHEIKVESIGEGEKDKNVNFCIIKKFAGEKLEGIKIIKLGGM